VTGVGGAAARASRARRRDLPSTAAPRITAGCAPSGYAASDGVPISSLAISGDTRASPPGGADAARAWAPGLARRVHARDRPTTARRAWPHRAGAGISIPRRGRDDGGRGELCRRAAVRGGGRSRPAGAARCGAAGGRLTCGVSLRGRLDAPSRRSCHARARCGGRRLDARGGRVCRRWRRGRRRCAACGGRYCGAGVAMRIVLRRAVRPISARRRGRLYRPFAARRRRWGRLGRDPRSLAPRAVAVLGRRVLITSFCSLHARCPLRARPAHQRHHLGCLARLPARLFPPLIRLRPAIDWARRRHHGRRTRTGDRRRA